MSYATDKGFKVGSFYRLADDDHAIPRGSPVKFTEDDGSTCPRFDAKGLDYDDWAYIHLEWVNNTEVNEDGSPIKPEVVKGAFDTFSIHVSPTSSNIHVSRALTSDEIGKISKILGEK